MTSMPNKTQKGIRDHERKIDLVKKVLGCSTRRQVIEAMARKLPKDKSPSRDQIESIIGASRKYNKSDPSRSVGPLYVEMVVNTLERQGWEHQNLKQLFVHDSYADFYQHSPSEKSTRSQVSSGSAPSNRISMGYSRPPNRPTIEQMVHDGHIDQLLVWQPEDAPGNWRHRAHHPRW